MREEMASSDLIFMLQAEFLQILMPKQNKDSSFNESVESKHDSKEMDTNDSFEKSSV